jgi:hypothetical protein
VKQKGIVRGSRVQRIVVANLIQEAVLRSRGSQAASVLAAGAGKKATPILQEIDALSAIFLGTFNPSDLTGLSAWYRSDLGITLDGSNNVEQWNDQSGGGFNLTQATSGDRPAYVSSGGPNNVPYVSYATITEVLTNTALALAAPVDMFVVCRFTGTGAGQPSPAGFTGLRFTFLQDSTTLIFPWNGTQDGSITFANQVDAVYEVSYASGTNACFLTINGGTPTTFTTGGSLASVSGFGIGNVSESMQGRVYEVILYDRQLTTTERAEIMAYLLGRYGI